MYLSLLQVAARSSFHQLGIEPVLADDLAEPVADPGASERLGFKRSAELHRGPTAATPDVERHRGALRAAALNRFRSVFHGPDGPQT